MEAPEDEMILADLIAVASAHGLRSCRGSLFKYKKKRRNGGWPTPSPRKAVACCVQGAAQLLSPSPYLPSAAGGNDALEHDITPYLCDDYLRGWNIGAAFEIALRGSDE